MTKHTQSSALRSVLVSEGRRIARKISFMMSEMAVVESAYATQKEQEKESEQGEEGFEEEARPQEKDTPQEGHSQKACSIEEKQRAGKKPERGHDSV
ncbi:MAG: hypothetical protein ACLQVG_09825 [Terriglobia bacterium]